MSVSTKILITWAVIVLVTNLVSAFAFDEYSLPYTICAVFVIGSLGAMLLIALVYGLVCLWSM